MTGSLSEAFKQLVVKLNTDFSLKDMRSLNFFLGIQVSRTNQGLFLSKKKYVYELLAKISLYDAKSMPTPMPCPLLLGVFLMTQVCIDKQ